MPADPTATAAQPRKVLVVDDNATMRRTFCDWLEKLGYATVEAASGAEGIELFRKEKFDILLTDLMMPGKNGLETIFEIRRIDPTVRIVAVSGAGVSPKGGDLLELAADIGAHVALAKPFQLPELREALKSIGEKI